MYLNQYFNLKTNRMKEQFEQMAKMQLVTIQQKQNLHVVTTDEGLIVFTKGRNLGFIVGEVFFLQNDYAAGGKMANAIIDSEIELLKQFYKCKAVTSQGELEQSEEAFFKIQELKNKMLNTEDSEIRKLIYDDLVKTIENSNVPAKETLLKNAEVDFNTPFVKNENSNSSATNVHPLEAILQLIKVADEDEAVESLYDRAIEELEKTPDDEKAIALFEEIKTIHSKYFVPDEEEEEEEEPKRKPAKKAAPKKVAPVKKAAAKKAPAKRK